MCCTSLYGIMIGHDPDESTVTFKLKVPYFIPSMHRTEKLRIAQISYKLRQGERKTGSSTLEGANKRSKDDHSGPGQDGNMSDVQY